MIFLLPVIIGLFVFKKDIRHSDSIMFLIMGVLLSAPILIAVSNITNTPYRFIHLIVFFAIGMGMMFSKRDSSNTYGNYKTLQF